MNSASTIVNKPKLSKLQLVKIVVYTLVIVNFFYYIWDDWVIASYTMREGGSFLEWTSAFAVSIDEVAWIVLLFLFELETYALSDDAFTRGRVMLMHVARVICYAFLAHTLYAYGNTVYDLMMAPVVEGVSDLCALIAPDVSFVFNLDYTDLDLTNCVEITTATQFFYTEYPSLLVVTDAEGLMIEQQLAWIDLAEAFVWLIILLTIEVVIRLQDRGISGSAMISNLNRSKIFLYGLLWGATFYWIYRGHYVYAWDEFVWIAGFAAIEMNMATWRQQIIESDAAAQAAAAN